MNKFKKVIVGISGGVDSAVSALLLKSKGFDVTGVFMKNWDIVNEFGECQAEKDFEDADVTCKQIGIPLVKVEFVKEYWHEVFSYTLSSYQEGRTPNPDIQCNRKIKFDAFFKYAFDKLGAEAVATGHYARTKFGQYLENYQPYTNNALLKAVDTSKDQTFFLSQVSQDSLRKTMFPLGDYFKHDVRQIAKKAKLTRIADKKESMGICFIGKRSFKNFINEYVEDKEGDFVDFETGEVLGKHNGIHQWTLGQGARLNGSLKAYFVSHKDVKNNIVYLVPGTDHPSLITDFVISNNIHWINKEPEALQVQSTYDCDFVCQHRDPPAPCTVYKTRKNQLLIRLQRPVRAITPGQFAVLYEGDKCLGSSEILYTGPSYYMLDKQAEDSANVKRRLKACGNY